MIQSYDYQKNEMLTFSDLDSLCEELNLKRKNVIKAISRETKVLRRYIICYGKLNEQLILDKKPKVYSITDIHTEETEQFNSFIELVNYANGILKADYPVNGYHRNMARNYISHKRFIIKQH